MNFSSLFDICEFVHLLFQEIYETATDVTKTLSIAVGILADLMTFNKIESGMMKLTKADVPIQTYVKDVVNTFAAESREKGIEIEIRDIHRSTEKTNKGSVENDASSVQGLSITMSKNSEKDKAMEQGRTRWIASTRRLVRTHLSI